MCEKAAVTWKNHIKIALLFVLTTLPPQSSVQAQADKATDFQGFVQLLAARARAEGVSEGTIAQMTAGLTENPRVIALDRAQPGAGSGGGQPSPIAPYIRSHVDGPRIAAGQAMYRQVSDVATRVERKYGVPASIVLSIWGNETHYGSYTGDFDLARSLATLAYEGRRQELFAGEFIALLKMADRGVPRSRLVGSWAGAFGNPQFLPSVYLRVAVDEDGDGMRDIWTSKADTMASIANYFRDAGWRTGQTWGVRASIPADFDRSQLANRLQSPSCGRVHARQSIWKTVAEWRALGISPLAYIKDDELATLFQPDGPGTSAFLLTGNYRVILQYNCSNYYALAVGLLADEIAR